MIDELKVITLRDQTARAALLFWALPIGDACPMNAHDLRYRAGASKFGNDALCWVHKLDSSDNRYECNSLVAKKATDSW